MSTLLTRPAARARQGTSLLEAIAAAVLTALVAVPALALLQHAVRAHALVRDRVVAEVTGGASLALLVRELEAAGGVDDASGPAAVMSVAALRGVGLTCAIAGASTVIDTTDLGWLTRSPVPGRDSAWWLAPNGSAWVGAAIRGVASAPCASGLLGVALELDPAPPGAGIAAPVRITERVIYAVGTSAGRPALLHRATATGATEAVAAPVESLRALVPAAATPPPAGAAVDVVAGGRRWRGTQLPAP